MKFRPIPSAMINAIASDFTRACLRAGGLSLSRGGRTLVRELSFSASPGEAVVITGPNGSGKTTLLRAVAGFIKPDAGDIHIEPRDAVKLAWLGHSDGLKPAETVRDALSFWARLHGAPNGVVDPVMERMAVAHLAGRACGTLSAGQRRRTALARLALSRAGVWILDEPTAPLDTVSRGSLASLIADYRAAGGVVVATTHAELDWPDQIGLDLTEAARKAQSP